MWRPKDMHPHHISCVGWLLFCLLSLHICDCLLAKLATQQLYMPLATTNYLPIYSGLP